MFYFFSFVLISKFKFHTIYETLQILRMAQPRGGKSESPKEPNNESRKGERRYKLLERGIKEEQLLLLLHTYCLLLPSD